MSKILDEKTVIETEQMMNELNHTNDEELINEEFKEIFEVSDEDINASMKTIDSSNDAEAQVVKRLKDKTKKSITQLAAEIVDAYTKERSEKNWKALMEFFWYGIKQYSMGYVHNQDDAYDMTIETFANAYEKFDSYDAEKAKFSTWLWSICRYNCINFLKRQARIPVVDTDISDVYDSAMLDNACTNSMSVAEYRVDSNHTIHNVSTEEITLELYKSAVDEIAKYKGISGQILEMKLVKDMKIKDIAAELNLNESTVKNHLYKGKRNLERILRINHKETYDMYIDNMQEDDNDLYA